MAPKRSRSESVSRRPNGHKRTKGTANAVPGLLDYVPDLASFKFETEASNAPRKVLTFGNGDNGQHGLGEDTMVEIKRPRLHKIFEEYDDKIVKVAAGGMHGLGIDEKGRVWSWGINDNGALGRVTNGKEELESTPALVEDLDGFRAVQVSAGDGVSLAVGDDGSVRCWGQIRGSEGPIGFPEHPGSKKQDKPVKLSHLSGHKIVEIATGDDHFLALTADGEVLACGNGEQFQLGRKLLTRRGKGAGLIAEKTGLRNIKSVGAGSYHSFAISHDGIVYGWGLNTFGQIGIEGESDCIEHPTVIESLSPREHKGARVVQITGGTHHTLFLFSDGTVYGTGRADGHEVGLPDDHPSMRALEAEKEDILKQRQEARVAITQKFVKDGKTEEEASRLAEVEAAQTIPLPNYSIGEPTLITFPDDPATQAPPNIVQISSGSRVNHAVSAKGTLYSWGFSNVCQLGLGNEEEAETPEVVANTALTTVKVISASAGGQHSMLIGVAKST